MQLLIPERQKVGQERKMNCYTAQVDLEYKALKL